MTQSALTPFSTIKDLSMSVHNFKVNLVFYEAACQANLGAEINFSGFNFYISTINHQIFETNSSFHAK